MITGGPPVANVAVAVLDPKEFVAVSVYVVVTEGFTLTQVP